MKASVDVRCPMCNRVMHYDVNDESYCCGDKECGDFAKWNNVPALLDLVAKPLQARISELETEKTKFLNGIELAIEVFTNEGALFCPTLKVVGYQCNNGNGCSHLDDLDRYDCWKNYLLSNKPTEDK